MPCLIPGEQADGCPPAGPRLALERPALETYARQIGLDPARFANALDTSAHQAAIDADSQLADSVGISGAVSSVVADSAGRVIFAGWFQGRVDFGDGPVDSGDRPALFVAALAP